MPYVFINHKLIPSGKAKISIDERGFLFGDGIFETCKIFAGEIYNYEAHKARIKAGLKALKFDAEIDDLKEKSLRLIKKNKIKNGILRISISRGSGSLGYLPTYESKSLIIIQTFAERKILAKKISLGIGSIKKPPKNSLPIHCKTAQALPSILNKIEAQKKGLFDCVMLSQKNFISETSSANIFWVKNGKVYTPSKACDCLPGTIREKLLKISPFKIYEVEAKINALKNADEIFLTNASFFILPVDEFVIFGRKEKVVKKLRREISGLLSLRAEESGGMVY